MSLQLFSALTRQAPEVERKIVKFAVGSIMCAVDIMVVREIILPRTTSPLHSMDESIVGVLDHRDAAIPVIDLRKRFQLNAPKSARQKWVIIALEDRNIALVVDMVYGVTSIHKNQKRDHSSLGGTDISWASEVYGDQDGLLFEIDLHLLAESVSSK